MTRTHQLIARFLLFLLATTFLFPAGDAIAKRKKGKKDPAEKVFVWPAPPEEPRIQYLRSLRTDQEFRKKKKTSAWKRLLLGPQKSKVVGLQKPYGVATDSRGRVYVTDSGLSAVVVFDEAEKTVQVISHASQVKFGTPIGIAVDGQDRIFISDVGLGRIVCMTDDGELIMAFGKKEGLVRPAGMAIDRDRSLLYVSDTPAHLIYVYGLDGKLVRTMGERGSGEGQLNFPTNVAVGASGHLFVVDTGNFRIQSFSPEGDFLSAFGEAGNGFGQFTRPKGIAVDSEGNIYIVDAAFNNFQIFNEEGNLLLFVGGYGQHPGGFWLPAGVHIDSSDRVYVADQVNMRVQVFQYMPLSNPEGGSDAESSAGSPAGPGESGTSR